MRIRRKLATALGIIVMFVAITGGIGILYTSSINDRLLVVTTQTNPTVETIDDLIIAIWKSAKTVEEFSNAKNLEELSRLEREFETTHSNYLTAKRVAYNLITDQTLRQQLDAAVEQYTLFTEKAYDLLYISQETVNNRDRETTEKLQIITRQATAYVDEAANTLEEISLRVFATNKGATAESFEAVRTTTRILLFMTLLSMASAAVIGLYLSRSIIRPINRLVDATAKLGKGDFEVIVPEPQRQDELTDFIRTFNNMVASLRRMVAKSPDLKKYFTIEERKVPSTDYALEPGTSYLLKTGSSSPAYRIAQEKTEKGYHILCISRQHPDEVKEAYNLTKAKFVWLKETKDGVYTTASSLSTVKKIIDEFITKHEHPLVVLDRIDYLITKHGFGETLRCIATVNDNIMSSKAIMLVPLDPTFMNEQNLAFLEKELKELDLGATASTALSDELNDILTFVTNRKATGKIASFKDVGKEFNITAPTVQKKVSELEGLGRIRISKQGRNKLMYPVTDFHGKQTK